MKEILLASNSIYMIFRSGRLNGKILVSLTCKSRLAPSLRLKAAVIEIHTASHGAAGARTISGMLKLPAIVLIASAIFLIVSISAVLLR